jgi:hypothetical protein
MRLLVLVLLALATAAAQERPLPDFNTFAAQVKARLATDEERQSGYTFLERRIEQNVDGAGRTKNESMKVFEVYPGLPGEDRYRRLIEEDGKPVAADKLAKQDRERREEVEGYSRKLADAGQRRKIDTELAKDRREFEKDVDDLFRVYDIRMVRREAIEGHPTIYATLTPRPGVKALTRSGGVMRHFKAQAWISESDHELVRVEIEAIDDVPFALGLLARLHKGTTATFQRRKVNDEVWLPEKVTWAGSARVLLLKRFRVRGVSEFSNYRKFTVDTSTTFGSPAAR